MNRATEIESLLTAADLAYFNTGEALMEDATYDALRTELRKLNPSSTALKRIGAAAGMLEKRTHTIPMGSLDKAMDKGEWETWVAKMVKAGHSLFTASLKMDGGSVSLEYKEGRLIQAVTRGDGFVGEDITLNVLRFKDVPTKGVKLSDKPFTGFVRAEIILSHEEWLKADPDQLSNPRNLGNGISRRKDGDQSELLTCYAFRAHFADGREIAVTERDLMVALTDMGFLTVSWTRGGADSVWTWFEHIGKERAGLPYWIDGVVVKVDDVVAQREMGESSQCPRAQVAIKFPAVGVETELLDVELAVGHTGAIIPTAKLKPCQIGGTTVSSALLCNWNVINALGVAIGDTVEVAKMGDIIPKLVRVISKGNKRKAIAQPTECPTCGGPVGYKTNTASGEESAALFCLNNDCPAKAIGKIARYITSLNILGIGDEVLDAMVEQLGVKSAADLYNLALIAPIFANAKLNNGRIGESRVAKILSEIEKTRELTLSEFLGSIGIEGLGKRRVTLIQAAVPGELDTLDDWLSGKLEGLADKAGVPNTGARISQEIVASAPFIQQFLDNGVIIKSDKPKEKKIMNNSKSFCITGALSRSRDEYIGMIEAAGHTFKSSVSKGLDYLVIADPDSASSKANKARQLGTKCIGEDELLEILGA